MALGVALLIALVTAGCNRTGPPSSVPVDTDPFSCGRWCSSTLLLLLAPPVPGQASGLVHIEHRDREQDHKADSWMEEVSPKPLEGGIIRFSCHLGQGAHGRH